MLRLNSRFHLYITPLRSTLPLLDFLLNTVNGIFAKEKKELLLKQRIEYQNIPIQSYVFVEIPAKSSPLVLLLQPHLSFLPIGSATLTTKTRKKEGSKATPPTTTRKLLGSKNSLLPQTKVPLSRQIITSQPFGVIMSLPPSPNTQNGGSAILKIKEDERTKDRKKVSCVHCRRIKRKCDGDLPCQNCVKKSVPCEYSQMDRRTQRYSIGYIKSLETNNEVYESTLVHLVSLRNNPKELMAKLEALVSSFPPSERLSDMANNFETNIDKLDLKTGNTVDDAKIEALPLEPYQYFGPGSIYHYLNFLRPEKEPIIAARESPENPGAGAVTIDEDYDYVALLVRQYFESTAPDIFKFLFDKDLIFAALDAHDLEGPYLNEDLLYAICANSTTLSYGEADAYCDLVLELLFTTITPSSIALSQCYTMLAVHTLGKGQILKGWLLAGLGIRSGLEVGFDIEKDTDLPLTANRCFMGTTLIDTYICMSLGRKPTILNAQLPILRLPSESDVDFYNFKYCVELDHMSREMLYATYKPVLFGEDPRVNYLLKFNRSKAFNVKLLKWKLSLNPCCTWQYSLMKASSNLVNENHTLKYFYNYVLLFLNKPFLHVPKQHLTVYIFEEISKEMLLIVQQKLQMYEEAGKVIPDPSDSNNISSMSLYSPSDSYFGASMDMCVLTLLCHVLVTLITSQPEEYMYLEKHFKVFAKFLQLCSPRKYKANNNPITRLFGVLNLFKKKMNHESLFNLEDSSAAEKRHAISPSHSGSQSSPQYSQGSAHSGRDTEDTGVSLDSSSKPSRQFFTNQNGHLQVRTGQHESQDMTSASLMEFLQQNGLNMQNCDRTQQTFPPYPYMQNTQQISSRGNEMPQNGYQEMGGKHMPIMKEEPGMAVNSIGSIYPLPPQVIQQMQPGCFDMNQNEGHGTQQSFIGQQRHIQRPFGFQQNEMFRNSQSDPQLQVFQRQLDRLNIQQAQLAMRQQNANTENLSPQLHQMSLQQSNAPIDRTGGIPNSTMKEASSMASDDMVEMNTNSQSMQGMMYMPQNSNAQVGNDYSRQYISPHGGADFVFLKNSQDPRLAGGATVESLFTYGHNSVDTPYHKIMGTLFSNGGDEFMLDGEKVNWLGLFNS